MIILGINAYHADSSACIFINGNLIAATEEERFKRIKIRTSLFINPSLKDIKLSKQLNVDCVEIHTGKISNLVKLKKRYSGELDRIRRCSILAKKFDYDSIAVETNYLKEIEIRQKLIFI